MGGRPQGVERALVETSRFDRVHASWAETGLPDGGVEAVRVSAVRVPSPVVPVVRWLRDRGLVYYRRARVVCCDSLDVDGQEPRFQIQEASEVDYRCLAPLEDNDVTEWLLRRGRGSLLLVVRSGPDYQGYQWISRSAEIMQEVDHTIDMTRDPFGAYLYGGYVLPSSRRKGVLRALLTQSKRWARSHGLLRLYAAFATDNLIPGHALERAGFTTIVGDVELVRILDRSWKRIRPGIGAPPFDVLGAASRGPGTPAT